MLKTIAFVAAVMFLATLLVIIDRNIPKPGPSPYPRIDQIYR